MDAIKKTWWLFAFIFLLWVCYPFMISSDVVKVWKPWLNWTTRGQLGDSFGALNTLFSGLALAGLAVNIYLQGVQIKKLEEKEQQNEDQLRTQARALRATALLEYYNVMIRDMESKKDEYIQAPPHLHSADILVRMMSDIDDAKRCRVEVVRELESL